MTIKILYIEDGSCDVICSVKGFSASLTGVDDVGTFVESMATFSSSQTELLTGVTIDVTIDITGDTGGLASVEFNLIGARAYCTYEIPV